jgi:hypothetical protein
MTRLDVFLERSEKVQQQQQQKQQRQQQKQQHQPIIMNKVHLGQKEEKIFKKHSNCQGYVNN